MKRVLSGIQPTADSFHLGNYLGALRNWVAGQHAGDVFHGAFIYGLLQAWDLEKIARFANAAAAMKWR